MASKSKRRAIWSKQRLLAAARSLWCEPRSLAPPCRCSTAECARRRPPGRTQTINNINVHVRPCQNCRWPAMALLTPTTPSGTPDPDPHKLTTVTETDLVQAYAVMSHMSCHAGRLPYHNVSSHVHPSLIYWAVGTCGGDASGIILCTSCTATARLGPVPPFRDPVVLDRATVQLSVIGTDAMQRVR